ncbi:kinase-like domain-containing protein [Chaetomium sp. MPI-CAGE-AT-0009]|nr:kinase-like domain-containing protein [Chaetomium sp. MPI-CAGE-AT-0009]
MEMGPKPTEMLDGPQGARALGPVDEFGFSPMLQNKQSSLMAATLTTAGAGSDMQLQSERPNAPPGKNQPTVVGQKPRLILDGSDTTTDRSLVDDSGFFLRNRGNDDEPTTISSSSSQGQCENPPVPQPFPGSPLPPTITTNHELILPKNLEVLGLGASGYVYKCAGGFAYKPQASQREVDLMTAAGDCSITPLSRVLRERDGVLVPSGLVMELATPFNVKVVPAEQRAAVMKEMVGLVDQLHGSKFGIVHGDIKPANFLRCRDGKLRLCDFDSARLIADEKAEDWEGFISDRYLAPSRGFPEEGRPPTVVDDEYALAISIWELFTGKDALIDEDMEVALKEGKTVDIEELEDDEVKSFVCKCLRAGGAKI